MRNTGLAQVTGAASEFREKRPCSRFPGAGRTNTNTNTLMPARTSTITSQTVRRNRSCFEAQAPRHDFRNLQNKNCVFWESRVALALLVLRIP